MKIKKLDIKELIELLGFKPQEGEKEYLLQKLLKP